MDEGLAVKANALAILERYDPGLLPFYNKLYGDNFYTPFSYQDELKKKAIKLCKKYTIRNSILA